MASNQDEVTIGLAESERDLEQAYFCLCEAFARQAKDSVWMLMNPGWDTEEGRKRNAQHMIAAWKSIPTNKDGEPNALYLTAKVPDPDKPGDHRVAGIAVWKQLSFVDGQGIAFTGDMSEPLKSLDDKNRRFAGQMFKSMWKRRIAYLHEVSAQGSGRNPPAIFVLDICGVDPAFQRRGIAAKLVQWGLEEAKKRGNLECTTEGSAMGRGVYRKLGFKNEGEGDIKWEVDDEFASWDKPPNIFLRTGV
ncbi:hypothetical protein BDZ85DRAFT_76986 [Elsinoe ampelina]|uniref:N-acetyltransferase domain-containing protein n=1 Tax=Elsinoe ampelina TaxID=302913 RepID=A0A6A6GKD4_9PEZI|nr:hypothetical protein BDZ85DRAFT_76986 [Elsinoe ampelina]